MSQKQSVLNHLREHGHINPMEALDLFASFRLSAIIFELRKEHHINTELVNDVNRFGKAIQYAKYMYIGPIIPTVNIDRK
tara:strand:- start:508 stop:747 length:240 start_codon:yes stop_codon:yes gene_type:complete